MEKYAPKKARVGPNSTKTAILPLLVSQQMFIHEELPGRMPEGSMKFESVLTTTLWAYRARLRMLPEVQKIKEEDGSLRAQALLGALQAMPETLQEVASRLHRHLANHVVVPADLETWKDQWESLKTQLQRIVEVNYLSEINKREVRI